MRINSIKIKNFRQYHSIDFSFPTGHSNDLHIIIASNGTGKTNLLNAINWCLYGDEPHVSGASIEGEEKRDKLPLANIQAMDECKNEGLQYCNVSVIIEAEDDETKYTFKREANISVSTELQAGKDMFEISIQNLQGTKFLSETEAIDLINSKMPKKIREYFFFDGEQLLNYFGLSGSNVSHLRDSIYEIAQVNILTNEKKGVIANLDTFIATYRKQIKSLSPNLEGITDDLDCIAKNVENKKTEIAKLEEQIAESENIIESCNNLIKNTDSIVEDNKHYEKNANDIAERKSELKSAKQELSKFARSYLIKIMLFDINKKTNDYIIERQNDKSISPISDMEIIKNSLAEHKCVVCGGELNSSAEAFFNSLIQKHASNVSLQKLTEIKNDIIRSLDLSGYSKEKQKIFERINKIENKIKDLEAENDSLYKIISKVSGLQEIEDAVSQRTYNQNLKESNLEKLGKYKEQLVELTSKYNEKNEEYKKAIESSKECDEINAKFKFVSRAKDLLIEIKNGIVSEITAQLENKTMELFEELIWKKDTYGRVELDENFKLKLYHKVTGASCLNSCSAAEKELLALAFTIAVHEVSGYDNLLFIDTPVGRVSDDNRENFAQVLLEVSKNKQIILEFTPSEYSDEIRSVINNNTVASIKELTTDEISTKMR